MRKTIIATAVIALASASLGLGKEESMVILINPFEVPAGKLDETIVMWEQARDFLQKQPGYLSTELHQSVSPGTRFQLVNVAKWESVETFTAATKKMQAEADLPQIDGLVPNPALYTIVRRD